MTPRRWHELRFLPELLVFLLTAAAFARAAGLPFVDWDDADLVLSNPVVGPAWPASWSGPVVGLYTPAAYTLWAALAATLGKPAWAFHGLNLLLHAAAATVCYRLLLKWLAASTPARADVAAALVGALFWALHPLKVEPVAWVSGMNNVLAGLFSLAALAAIPRPDDASRRGWSRYGWASLLFVLALLSKPTALVVPLMAAAAGGARTRTGVARLALWLLAAAAIGWVARGAQPVESGAAPDLLGRLTVAADALGWYAARTVFPWPLTVDHGRTPAALLSGQLGWHYAALGTLLLATAAVSGAALFRHRPPSPHPPCPPHPLAAPTATVLALSLAALAANLGLQPFAFQDISTVAERYAYLALLGPALALAWATRTALARPAPARTAILAAALLTLAACALLTQLALSPWRSSHALFTRALAVNPDSALAYRVLAFVAAREGQGGGSPAEAEALYRKSLALRPTDGTARLNLGNLLLRRGDLPGAFEQLSVAAEARTPRVRSNALTNRGIILEQTARPPDAERDYLAAIAADPRNPAPLSNLANLRERQGDLPAARDLYTRALALDPTLPPALRGLQRLSR